MFDQVVKKIVARDGERELIDSSSEEMQRFIVDRQRPDFDDESILCVKFLQSDSDSMEFAEESSWFINPVHVKGFAMFDRIPSMDEAILEEDDTCCCSYVDADETICNGDVDDEIAMEFASTFGYSPNEAYGPKMAAEFLPEILILQPQFPNECMLEEYQRFYGELLKHGLSALPHEEKLNLFSKYLKCEKFCKKPQVIIEYLKAKVD
ncbi:MAG: hypothetical protein IJ272_00890 [Clostridia bacterium]|nr:hypothetical protein [Clostridia bacterium]